MGFVQVTAGVRHRDTARGGRLSGGVVRCLSSAGCRAEWVPCWPDLLISIPSGPRLPVSGVSETSGHCSLLSAASTNRCEMRRNTNGAPFPLLDVGGVGLVHGIEHIDLHAGCV